MKKKTSTKTRYITKTKTRRTNNTSYTSNIGQI